MKELPGQVFVSPQILPEHIEGLAKQGFKSVVNNRPDMEVSAQPLSDEMSEVLQANNLEYEFIPMAGHLTHQLIEDAVKAYETLPRPILAFCASGTRSTVLWCFAHVKSLGVDEVLDGAAKAGYDLERIRGSLTQFMESRA